MRPKREKHHAITPVGFKEEACFLPRVLKIKRATAMAVQPNLNTACKANMLFHLRERTKKYLQGDGTESLQQ